MDKETLFFKCPKCGNYGRAGKECEFCGEPVVETEEGRTYDSLFPRIQTIPADVFAARISKFDDVDRFYNNLAIVVTGYLWGVINRNGEIVLPLQYVNIVNKVPGYISVKETDTPWNVLCVDDYSFLKNDDNTRVSGEVVGEKMHNGHICLAAYNLDCFIYDRNTRKRITQEKGVDHIQILLDGYLCCRNLIINASSPTLYSLVSVDGAVICSFDDPIRICPVHYDNSLKEEMRDPDALRFDGDLPGITGIKYPPFWSFFGNDLFVYKLDNSTPLERQFNRMKEQFIEDYKNEVQRAKKKLSVITIVTAIAILIISYLMIKFI